MSVSRQVTRWLERLLLIVGFVCLGYYGYQTLEARHYQREQTAAIEQRLAQRTSSAQAIAAPSAPSAPAPSAPSAPAPSAPSAPNAPSAPSFALLTIPRLNLSTPVASGDSSEVLDVAVGHLRDTPLPWEPGNSAFAGHRDGLFRPLRNIRVGDDVIVRAEQGEFVYRVYETKIVRPDDLSVLAPSEGHRLTLITCYPFNFIGNAPKRFIVHAERIADARPETPRR